MDDTKAANRKGKTMKTAIRCRMMGGLQLTGRMVRDDSGFSPDGLSVEYEQRPNVYITGLLTTDHAASSYGQPVLIVDDVTYGPDDLLPGGCRAYEICQGSAYADDELVGRFVSAARLGPGGY